MYENCKLYGPYNSGKDGRLRAVSLNNDISNLRIIKRNEHAYNDAKRNKDIIYKCDYCGKEFIIKGEKLHYMLRKDRENSAHFCSRQCAGKYNAERQHNKIDKIEGKDIKKETFTFHIK